MPRKKPEPRKGKETRRTNFVLQTEGGRKMWKTKKVHDIQGDLKTVHPKAFGTKNQVASAKYIGNIRARGDGKTTHWHVDRRKKKGTIADRKNK